MINFYDAFFSYKTLTALWRQPNFAKIMGRGSVRRDVFASLGPSKQVYGLRSLDIQLPTWLVLCSWTWTCYVGTSRRSAVSYFGELMGTLIWNAGGLDLISGCTDLADDFHWFGRFVESQELDIAGWWSFWIFLNVVIIIQLKNMDLLKSKYHLL